MRLLKTLTWWLYPACERLGGMHAPRELADGTIVCGHCGRVAEPVREFVWRWPE
jgi:hypothetical protein